MAEDVTPIPATAAPGPTPAPADVLGTVATRRVDLDVAGMTCASCVGRVERKLGRLDGVEATVNLPLERATVLAPESVSDAELIAAVEKAGYEARLHAPVTPRRSSSAAAAAEGASGATADGRHAAARTDARSDAPADGPADTADVADPALESTPDAGHGRRLGPRLLVAALFSLPTVLISMVPALQFPHWGWVALALSLPVVAWCAWPFHAAAARAAQHGSSTMDTLVSVGVLVSWGYSAIELLLHPAMTEHGGMGGMAAMAEHSLYFETAAVITTFLLLGRWLEARAKREAGAALRALLDLGAAQATLLPDYDAGTPGGRDLAERVVPAEGLTPGDVVLIRPGEKVPTDAVVLEGASAVDASLLTGESVPVEVGPGDELTGATLNTSGRLVARATRIGADTTLAQMGRLVSDAQTGKARAARLADRISAVFVPVVLVIAVLTFAVWMRVTDGDAPAALRAGVAVLVIACPCALGLATPVGLLAGTGRASQLGILIRGPEVLEDTRTVDTIVLDKTGTVTEGRMRLADVRVLGDGGPVGDGGAPRAEDALLALAAAVEHGSEHPIARAVVDGARERGLEIAPVVDFTSTPGGGVTGTVSGTGPVAHSTADRTDSAAPRRVAVGRGEVIAGLVGGPIPAEHAAAFAAAEDAGATAVWVAVDGLLAGILSVTDTVKASSTDSVARLKALGLRPLLVTGDNAAVAARVGAAVGIRAEDVVAGVRPEDKVEVVRRLQAEGAVVAMVGDGVNDAPALAAADMGVAMGSGTDVAREAAQITVLGDDLAQVVQALELSRRTLGIIRMNLFWAFAYNVLGIPVAALGLLNPMIAGGAMAASSVLVVLNSLRLTRYGR